MTQLVWQRQAVWVLGIVFIVFVGMTAWRLPSVPGLLGDEGSEGENVYELLAAEGVAVVGERSYIGPLIDYARVPFVHLFGYTPLALRVPVFLLSLIFFWLTVRVVRRGFGQWEGLIGATAMLLSPIYLLYQRLGWAISLTPLFAMLMIWLAQSRRRYKWVWFGLAAGVGLANHILFLPVIPAVAVGIAVMDIWPWRGAEHLRRWGIALGLAAVGFWAGFGMQFTVLSLFGEDQGDSAATRQLFSERVALFGEAAPLYLSGSSYAARYTGEEMSGVKQLVISSLLGVLVLLGTLLYRKNRMWWALLGGSIVYLLGTLYIIDRFTLRYFVLVSLLVWLMAGLGLGAAVYRLGRKPFVPAGVALALASVLTAWVLLGVFRPFMTTGGSVNDFPLGDRTNSAAAFVDHRPLVECLQERGPVWAEDVHIWNRLQYLSHQYLDLQVVSEQQKSLAVLEVHYRDEETVEKLGEGDVCSELAHFLVRHR